MACEWWHSHHQCCPFIEHYTWTTLYKRETRKFCFWFRWTKFFTLPIFTVNLFSLCWWLRCFVIAVLLNEHTKCSNTWRISNSFLAVLFLSYSLLQIFFILFVLFPSFFSPLHTGVRVCFEPLHANYFFQSHFSSDNNTLFGFIRYHTATKFSKQHMLDCPLCTIALEIIWALLSFVMIMLILFIAKRTKSNNTEQISESRLWIFSPFTTTLYHTPSPK